MNEVSTEPIAQTTEEVTDLAENVEFVDAPPVSELVEQARDEVSSTESALEDAPICDEAIPAEPIEQVALIEGEVVPAEAVEDVAPEDDGVVPVEAVVEVAPEHAEIAAV
jgi:hypothetical protein